MEVDRCPMHYLSEPHPERNVVVAVASDRRVGIEPHWPDGYAAWVVEGVRTLEMERGECQTLLHERRMREARRHGDR